MEARERAVDSPGPARRAWLRATLAGALLLTAFDAILIQQKKAFFTGGFLADAYTASIGEAVGFLLLSFVTDAAVIGLLAALALAASARWRLTSGARTLAALIAGTAPLVLADFVTYRLASYLGDAFDLSLLFDLTGRQPGEFAAVASAHLAMPILLIGMVSGAAGGVVWLVNRLSRRPRTAVRVPIRLLAGAAALLAGGIFLASSVSAASETFDDGLGRKPSGQLAAWITEHVTDVDRDGFGIGGTSSDPAPFDAAIYPYALDLPGNGIDEDGVAGDLPAGAAPYTEDASPPAWQHRPNVVLIVLESFRADAFGRVVNGKPVTPVLDALALGGASTTALSHNGYTAQSRFHIFSGSLAGLRGGKTLVDDFKANGYEVGYFSGQDDSFGGDAFGVGIERADVGYDARQDRRRRYTSFTTAGSLAVPFEVVQERVEAFLARRDRARPLFLYVNFHDSHYPYHRPGLRPLVSDLVLPEAEIGPARAAALRDMYFNTAANVDAAIGSTLAMVTKALGAPPAVIATADHGESLFDQGFLGHGYALDDAQTRIPLVVSGLPFTIEEPFGQVDLRDALGRALSAPSFDAAPRVTAVPGKRVFQYLGRIDRPRQIAFSTNGSRTIYDFRTHRIQIAGGSWQRPTALTEGDAAAFRELVQTWERMILARAAGKTRP